MQTLVRFGAAILFSTLLFVRYTEAAPYTYQYFFETTASGWGENATVAESYAETDLRDQIIQEMSKWDPACYYYAMTAEIIAEYRWDYGDHYVGDGYDYFDHIIDYTAVIQVTEDPYDWAPDTLLLIEDYFGYGYGMSSSEATAQAMAQVDYQMQQAEDYYYLIGWDFVQITPAWTTWVNHEWYTDGYDIYD